MMVYCDYMAIHHMTFKRNLSVGSTLLFKVSISGWFKRHADVNQVLDEFPENKLASEQNAFGLRSKKKRQKSF